MPVLRRPVEEASPTSMPYHTRGTRRYRTLCIYSAYPGKFLRRKISSSRMRQTSTGKNGRTRRTLHHEPSASGIAASRSNAPEYIGCRTYAYGPVDTTGTGSSSPEHIAPTIKHEPTPFNGAISVNDRMLSVVVCLFAGPRLNRVTEAIMQNGWLRWIEIDHRP